MNKLFYTAFMLLSLSLMDVSANQCPKALDFEIKRLGEDKVENLCDYKGNVILVVNTASKCGFTPQYEGLEKLYSEKKDKGFVVLGIPFT
jgi:glutathione peroxidase